MDPLRGFEVAKHVFRAAGLVLIVVGGLHLIVTPLLAGFIARAVGPGAWDVIGPPTLLNHVVVGILLIPVGAGAVSVAPSLREPWAWRLAWVTALSVAALPACLIALMRGEAYRAPAFVVAEVLVTAVGVTLPIALAWAGFARRAD